MIAPIASSALADTVPTCAIALRSLHGTAFFLISWVTASTALSMPRLMSIGSMPAVTDFRPSLRSEEHTSELQSLMRISYAVFCLKKQKKNFTINQTYNQSKKKNRQYTNNI